MNRFLGRIAAFAEAHASLVVVVFLVLGLAAAVTAARGLGMSADINALFAKSLPWVQRQAEFDRNFPQFRDLLVAVIKAKAPEEADATAAQLAAAASRDPVHFRTVSRPDSGPFFNREGLLLLPRKKLATLLGQIITAQPFLGELVSNPSAGGLFSALTLLAKAAEHQPAALGGFSAPLESLTRNLNAAASGHPEPLSWENLLSGPAASLAGGYRFVLLQPVLDQAATAPGIPATRALRRIVAFLPYVRAGLARVQITGDVAINDDQFTTAAQGALTATLVSTALVLLWLMLALGSWRLIVPTAVTLALGLVLTFGFATLAVGTLNVISVAFAVLFIGLAVDFTIQIGVRYQAALAEEAEPLAALKATYERAGPQVLLAAAALACGFLAFVPTAFRGVGELGLIAGAGMVIAFLCTVLFLPAALTLCKACQPAPRFLRRGPPRRADFFLAANRLRVLGGFLGLAVAGTAVVPRVVFDSNPLHTQNSNTEAIRTLEKLMKSPLTNPFTASVLVPSPQAARTMAARLAALPQVADVLWAGSFVPDHQAEKQGMIAEAHDLLAPTLSAPPDQTELRAKNLRSGLRATASAIMAAEPKLAPNSPLFAIAAALKRLESASDPQLLALNENLIRFLPTALAQISAALNPAPVSLASLPANIRRDWITPGGRYRIEVLPRATMNRSGQLGDFVAAIRRLAPDATDTAVTTADTAATILGAFRSAAFHGFLAIALLLALVLRRVRDVLLVLAPLTLSALLTALAMIYAHLSLNYANIIALPLLLGVGVSFNVYFVMNWRAGERAPLSSPSALAVAFSALTTGSAFGALAFSTHPGLASMGELLLIGLAMTLVATFLFVPAALAATERDSAANAFGVLTLASHHHPEGIDGRAKGSVHRPSLASRGHAGGIDGAGLRK